MLACQRTVCRIVGWEAAVARLETLVIAADLGEAWFARLRERVPDLTLVVCRDAAEVAAALPEADGFLGWQLDVAAYRSAAHLGWIQAMTAGVDGFLVPELAERGTLLTNTSGVHVPNAAEHVLALMLGFARGLPALYAAQARQEWRQRTDLQFELSGQTVCVVGLGDIGLALAERARGLGMRVTGVRRQPTPVAGVERVATSETMAPLLAQADHVALCLPLTPETRGVFDRERIAQIKRGAYLYNVGRGETLDHAALVAALRERRLAGAGLDVTDPEPLPVDHPLWSLETVVITSHTSGGSPNLWDRVLELLVDNIARYREDRPLRNLVDPLLGY